MPYYIHLASVSADALREALQHARNPPDASIFIGCGCDDCIATAWRIYWNANPDKCTYGVKPDAVPSSVLAMMDTAAQAHEAKRTLAAGEPLAVTFVPTEDERATWRSRERAKMSSYGRRSDCVRVPWYCEPWYAEDRALDDGTSASLAETHHAYLSVAKPGLVAYTPSEEWGVTDRQLAVRPGKYLEQFAPHLTTTERDTFVAQCKAIDDGNVVRFAVTARDVVRVYQHGPDSCMSHSTSSYSTDGTHPTAVYGDSPDLQLAYLADSDTASARARVLVWPEKKIFSRIYGDATLRYLLEALGYRSGSLVGARVRAIEIYRGCYVMPYVDGIETADKTDDGKFFIFCDDDERGRYATQETNGTTESNPETEDEDDNYSTCAHCDTQIDDGDVYCQSCDDSRYTCEYCNDEFFSDDPDDVDGYGMMCRGCYRCHSTSCEECSDRFVEDSYGTHETETREAHDVTRFCLSCGADAIAAREEEREAEAQRIAEEERIAAIREEERARLQALADIIAHAMKTNGIVSRAYRARAIVVVTREERS